MEAIGSKVDLPIFFLLAAVVASTTPTDAESFAPPPGADWVLTGMQVGHTRQFPHARLPKERRGTRGGAEIRGQSPNTSTSRR